MRSGRGALALAFRGLRQALEMDRPDVLHVISEPWGLLAVQAAAWRRRDPHGGRLALHGCDTLWHHGTRAKRMARRALLQYTLPVTDAWAAESHKALDVAAKNGLRANTILARVHTNPRDARTFAPIGAQERDRVKLGLGIPLGRTTVGLVARLVPEKGVHEFIEAARALLASGFPGHFLIAGDGPLAGVARGAACDGIRFLGPLDHPKGVRDLLRALDVIACPSTTTPRWEDQGPRIVLEGMLCGCVPAAAPTGAIPEMLDGHGVVARSTSASDLAAAVVGAAGLARDPSRRAETVGYALGRFSTDAVASQILEMWTATARSDRRPVG